MVTNYVVYFLTAKTFRGLGDRIDRYRDSGISTNKVTHRGLLVKFVTSWTYVTSLYLFVVAFVNENKTHFYV